MSETVITLDIPKAHPFFGKSYRKLLFDNSSLRYVDKDKVIEIAYSSLTQIAYQTTVTIINCVPTLKDLFFEVSSENHKIQIGLQSFYFFSKSSDIFFAKLQQCSQGLIERPILLKLLEIIFISKKPILIGGVEITEFGYIKTTFWGGRDIVFFDDKTFLPEIKSGYVELYKNVKGKKKLFKSVSLRKPNAIILPQLISVCLKQNSSADSSKK